VARTGRAPYRSAVVAAARWLREEGFVSYSRRRTPTAFPVFLVRAQKQGGRMDRPRWGGKNGGKMTQEPLKKR
jgi:hypothetical protein